MEILITGSTGGIGSAIKERLKDHSLTCVAHTNINSDIEFDWMICAHGFIDENSVVKTIDVNLIFNILLVEQIKAKNIIFISSASGIKGNDKFPIYSASKAALNMYCKSISSKKNCYAICPGPTDTKMWRGLGLEGEPQSPDEVAKVVEQIMNGEFKSGDLITVRNGEIT